MDRHTITVKDCALSVLRGGEGPPLLYLHGANGVPGELPFMTDLAGGFDLLVPEHPGFGASDDPDWLDDVHDLAYFYLDLLAHLELRGVHLVGSSLGGWIALEMAVRNTSRLASLTLAAPAGIHVEGLQPGDLFLWSPEETLRRLIHDPKLAENAIARLPEGVEGDPVYLKNRTTAAKLLWHPRLHDPRLEKWLHRIDVPTAVIWGREDRLLPAGYARAFARLIPGARVELLPDCGHLAHLEKPADFVRIVRENAAMDDR